jgi:hypothetical protein
MTPKEKAKELFNKFYMAIPSDEMGKCYESSKQCALIAADELIELSGYTGGYYGWMDYYEEVKQEIEKL